MKAAKSAHRTLTPEQADLMSLVCVSERRLAKAASLRFLPASHSCFDQAIPGLTLARKPAGANNDMDC